MQLLANAKLSNNNHCIRGRECGTVPRPWMRSRLVKHHVGIDVYFDGKEIYMKKLICNLKQESSLLLMMLFGSLAILFVALSGCHSRPSTASVTGLAATEQPNRSPASEGDYSDVIAYRTKEYYAMDTCRDTMAAKELGFMAAYVTRIIDGDTIVVQLPNGVEERVRFIGVDAPEMNFRSDEPPEDGAQEATDFVAGLIPPGTMVWLESRGNDRDRFERLRRYIWLEIPICPNVSREELTLNRLLVAYGHAVDWGPPSGSSPQG